MAVVPPFSVFGDSVFHSEMWFLFLSCFGFCFVGLFSFQCLDFSSAFSYWEIILFESVLYSCLCFSCFPAHGSTFYLLPIPSTITCETVKNVFKELDLVPILWVMAISQSLTGKLKSAKCKNKSTLSVGKNDTCLMKCQPFLTTVLAIMREMTKKTSMNSQAMGFHDSLLHMYVIV